MVVNFLLILVLSSCAYTTAVKTDEQEYPPTEKVEILFNTPNKPYKVIAIIESDGAAGMQHTELIESMREKAKTLGADAIFIGQAETQQTPTQLMYNPWLGGYQTLGGWNKPKLKALAIKYTK